MVDLSLVDLLVEWESFGRWHAALSFSSINQELHSWVQDHYRKFESPDNHQPVTLSGGNSISIPSHPDVPLMSDSIETHPQHIPRKVALLNRRSAKYVIPSSDESPFNTRLFRTPAAATRGQLQPYKGYEPNYDDFIHAIDRKNDTLYFVSFKRVCHPFSSLNNRFWACSSSSSSKDHLILPATVMNQTQRPKMSLILPASITHLNSKFDRCRSCQHSPSFLSLARIYSCATESCSNDSDRLWSRRYEISLRQTWAYSLILSTRSLSILFLSSANNGLISFYLIWFAFVGECQQKAARAVLSLPFGFFVCFSFSTWKRSHVSFFTVTILVVAVFVTALERERERERRGNFYVDFCSISCSVLFSFVLCNEEVIDMPQSKPEKKKMMFFLVVLFGACIISCSSFDNFNVYLIRLFIVSVCLYSFLVCLAIILFIIVYG